VNDLIPAPSLSLFDQRDGLRYQANAGDTPRGQLAHLEARHRAHARVEDRIRQAKDTGIGRFPSRQFALNAAWLELALTAIDLIAWTQHLLLDGDLATCEPKALRYRLLHTAARITRGQRRTYIRLAEHWKWSRDLATAFQRLTLIPHPLNTHTPDHPRPKDKGTAGKPADPSRPNNPPHHRPLPGHSSTAY
jgi:hypothetical protein